MKNIFIILISVSFILLNSAFAQTIKEAKFQNDSVSLNRFLDKYFRKNIMMKDELYTCEVIATGVMFKINKKGLVADVKFSIGTPETFKASLEEMLNATNGNWETRKINSKSVESQPFYIPIIFVLNYGCEDKKKEDFGYGIWNMLLFNNPTDTTRVGHGVSLYHGYQELDCILLHPLIIKKDVPIYD